MFTDKSENICFTYDVRLSFSWYVVCARKNVFRCIFFAANAVRLVSFLFTLYSNRMYNAQCCVCRCERVVNVQTDWADSSRRMWHFPRMRFQKMRNDIIVCKYWTGTHLFPALHSDDFVGFSDGLPANTATWIYYCKFSLIDVVASWW